MKRYRMCKGVIDDACQDVFEEMYATLFVRA